MSVILVAEHYAQIRKTVRHLLAQTMCDKLELVIVAPSKTELAADDQELQAFPWLQVVEIGPIASVPSAMAAGIERAQSRVVAFAENHSFPEPDWAEALLAAHRQGWAAVGPAVENANPGSITSWAGFLMNYARWMPPLSARSMEVIPGHASAYRRDLLLQYGKDLARMLELELFLHWDLHSKGHRLYLEARAVTHHVNFSRFSYWISSTFLYSQKFAALRSQRWPLWRRVLYALGSPLIPLIRLRRILPDIYRTEHRNLLPKVLPPLTLGLMVGAMGEMLGYLFGEGNASQTLNLFELDRTPFLRQQDHGLLR